MRKKIVIVGATSSIAEHCARLWVQSSDLVLIGRDESRTEAIAKDLRIRNAQATIEVLTADFLNPADIQKTVQTIFEKAPVDIALVAHGSLPDQKDCEKDLNLCQSTLTINGTSPVLFAEAFASSFEKMNHGTIAVIGSVAGDRGRKANYVYGAAKALVRAYMQGMQHRFSGTKIKAILINPGPTDTPMTVQYKAQGRKMATAESVAKDIVAGIEKGQLVIYTPRIFSIIMWVIRKLPSCIFNKLNI